MSEVTVKPQTITRTIPSYYDRNARERIPERTYEDRTGWWEATTNEGLSALATTPEGARQMIERMRDARKAASS